MIIVIGGSGFIGSKICKYFSEKDKLLAGTYYSSPKPGMIYFNLEESNIAKLKVDLKKASYAIICSNISHIDACHTDEKKSYKINVEGIKKLIKQLYKWDIIPIFLSSDHVFDGKKGNYNDFDPRKPIVVYGHQKKMVEDFLLKSEKPFLIMRLSKIFGLKKNDKTMITSWVDKLLNDEVIYCSNDQTFSPTYVGDIVRAVDASIKKDIQGCFNVSSPQPFSRFQLATIVKSHLKIKSGEIVPCSINDLNFLEKRPLTVSLNSSKFIRETDFEFTKTEKCIDFLKKEYRQDLL